MAVAKGIKLHYCGHGKHGQRPSEPLHGQNDQVPASGYHGRRPSRGAGSDDKVEQEEGAGEGRMAAADCIRDQIGACDRGEAKELVGRVGEAAGLACVRDKAPYVGANGCFHLISEASFPPARV